MIAERVGAGWRQRRADRRARRAERTQRKREAEAQRLEHKRGTTS